MKRLTLAAIIAAALFAMPVHAHHGTGKPPNPPPNLPKPLPAINLAAEVSAQTYHNGQTRKVTLSWTVPEVSITEYLESISYFWAIIDSATGRRLRYSFENGRRYNRSKRMTWPRTWESALYLPMGRYRFGVSAQNYYAYPVPEHPERLVGHGSAGIWTYITVDITENPPPPPPPPPPPTPPPPPPPTTGHWHSYAGISHSHAYASTSHTHPGQTGGPPHEHPYAATEHEHPYAAGEHEHDTVPAHAHQAAPGACRWEHRFNTFPPADSTGRGVLRISARKKGAQVHIEAFDREDGTGLTILDLAPDRDRLESGSSVTLGAANTVERFAIEGDSGQHTLIVSHAEHVAGMRAVTASMVRQSGGTSQVIHPDVVEHCEPTGTETTP